MAELANKWGLLPDEVRSQLLKREWLNYSNLKNRLKGDRTFPLEVSLKPPASGTMMLSDTANFQAFVQSWKNVNISHSLLSISSIEVRWENRSFRHFGTQNIPTKLVLHSIQDLACFLGKSYVAELKNWQERLQFLFQSMPKNEAVFRCLIDFLSEISLFSSDELSQLRQLIPQLKQNMGQGCYLRALKVVGVDSKFIESHFKLIENLLHSIHQNVLPDGLLNWLDCLEKPKDWLLVKPLCHKTQNTLGNLPILRLNSETLRNYPLPAQRILIVENEQSCLALPELSDCIAVAGGGKNIAWLNATWLQNKTVGYWGDIDYEGLMILNQARTILPNLTALMMNEQTLLRFQARMVNEPAGKRLQPEYLTCQEKQLFDLLQAGVFGKTRLEQERLDNDWILSALNEWLSSELLLK